MPTPIIKTEEQAQYCFAWDDTYARHGASIVKSSQLPILNLGNNDGYYDLTAETGALVQNLKDFTISVYFKVDTENRLDGYGHFLFAFSQLAENKAEEGPYMAMRLNEQRFETSTGGYNHEQIVMQGGQPKRNVWVHALFRQQGTKGELYLDGKLIGTNNNMPILSDIFKDAPAYCWIGRAPFKGDKYLTHSHVADFRIYNYAVSNKELQELNKRKSLLK
ncbi:MAG: LamG domain-containing protein [Bacteroidaceae bacterium]|nr:LamG domain-containing protein [Bacteroidaceae bacterium]